MALSQMDPAAGEHAHQKADSSESRQKTLMRLARYAKLLDSQFQLPGTSIRFGWDAIIGLLPGFGDILAFGLSALLIVEAKLAGAPLKIMLRMLGNAVIEMVLGMVPIFGDIFDVYWKANLKNIDLLKNHLGESTRPASAQRRRYWLISFYLSAVIVLLAASYLLWIQLERILVQT